MGKQPPERTSPLSVVIRKWAIRVGIAALLFEVFYLVAANAFLRTGLLTDLINKKPEKMNITWDSAVTYLPRGRHGQQFRAPQPDQERPDLCPGRQCRRPDRPGQAHFQDHPHPGC